LPSGSRAHRKFEDPAARVNSLFCARKVLMNYSPHISERALSPGALSDLDTLPSRGLWNEGRCAELISQVESMLVKKGFAATAASE
jgi:hypothetical protein